MFTIVQDQDYERVTFSPFHKKFLKAHLHTKYSAMVQDAMATAKLSLQLACNHAIPMKVESVNLTAPRPGDQACAHTPRQEFQMSLEPRNDHHSKLVMCQGPHSLNLKSHRRHSHTFQPLHTLNPCTAHDIVACTGCQKEKTFPLQIQKPSPKALT